jgi:hypothetical protein
VLTRATRQTRINRILRTVMVESKKRLGEK